MNSDSTVKHVDNPSSRGGSEEAPWHFHTGQGSVVIDYQDSSDHNNIRIKSNCDLLTDTSYADPDCREKVYYFTHSEIMGYVNQAKEMYEAKLDTATATMITFSTVAVISAKTAYAGLIAPDPTLITSKLISVGAAVGAGISGVIVAWQGKKMSEILALVDALDLLMREEASFVRRCGHVRSNFLENLEKLGVSLVFPKNGGDYIPASEYIGAYNEENELISETLSFARDKGIPSRAAYKQYFLQQCGQLPTIHKARVQNIFLKGWENIPENIKQKTFELSQKIRLKNGAVIEYAKFDSNDFDNQEAQQSILNFLDVTSRKFDQMSSDPAGQEKFASFHRNIDFIIIQPAWKSWGFLGKKETSRLETSGGKNYLFVYALWSFGSQSYEISLDF